MGISRRLMSPVNNLEYTSPERLRMEFEPKVLQVISDLLRQE